MRIEGSLNDIYWISETILLTCCGFLLCCVFFYKSKSEREIKAARERELEDEHESSFKETAGLMGKKGVRHIRSKNILWQNYATLSRSRTLSIGMSFKVFFKWESSQNLKYFLLLILEKLFTTPLIETTRRSTDWYQLTFLEE